MENEIEVSIENVEKDKMLVQSNDLTVARYQFSACEMDIFFCVLAKLKKTDTESTMYNISIQEIQTLTGREYNYQQFKKATYNMQSRVYEIESKDDKGIKRILQVSLVSSAEYIDGQGMVEIELSQKLRPYLFDLKNNFTCFSLKSSLLLTSKYAKRFYQLASQWQDIGVKRYEIDFLKYILMLKDPEGKKEEQFKKISAFREYVLEPAKKQINEHTNLTIDYELIKEGRAYKKIDIYINAKKAEQLEIDFSSEEEYNDEKDIRAARILDELNIKDKSLRRAIIKNHKEDLFKWNYDRKLGNIEIKKSASGMLLRHLGLR